MFLSNQLCWSGFVNFQAFIGTCCVTPFSMTLMKTAIFAFVLPLVMFLLISCSSRNPADEVQSRPPTEAPYKSEEPERYQTFIVQKTAAETVRFFVARDGNKWRIDSAYGTPVQTSSLHTDKDYVLAFGPRVYSEYESVHGYDERPDVVQEITHGMINNKDIAVYEKTDDNGGLIKYKYLDQKGKESIVTYDTAKGIPIRKELFSIRDGARTSEVVISLEEFSTEVDPSNFELPKEFKRVSPQEMRSILSASLQTK